MAPSNFLISPAVRALLPDVLIEYLCGLAASEENKNQRLQIFTLTPGELGGQSLQTIRHMNKVRRVFGFTPVCCNLRVLNDAGQYLMALES